MLVSRPTDWTGRHWQWQWLKKRARQYETTNWFVFFRWLGWSESVRNGSIGLCAEPLSQTGLLAKNQIVRIAYTMLKIEYGVQCNHLFRLLRMEHPEVSGSWPLCLCACLCPWLTGPESLPQRWTA